MAFHHAPLAFAVLRGRGYREWTLGGPLLKKLVDLYGWYTGPGDQVFFKCNELWQGLAALLPSTQGGLELKSPLLNGGNVVHDHLQRYLWLVRTLCIQVFNGCILWCKHGTLGA